MLGKLFGKNVNQEEKEYTSLEKQNLAKKFIKSYIANSSSNGEIVKSVIIPLHKELDQETKIQKYRHVTKDIKLGQYNKDSLQIFSGMLFKDLVKEKKDGVYEDIAKNLASDVSLDETANKRLKAKADRLLDAYGVSAQQIRQIRQDAEFAKTVQANLRFDEDTQKAIKLSKNSSIKRSDSNEEEKREEEAYITRQNDDFYSMNPNIQPNTPYVGSSTEDADKKLAMKLQKEEDSKVAAVKSRKPEEKNFQQSVKKKNDISPEAILNQRQQQRSGQRQDFLDTMGDFMPPF